MDEGQGSKPALDNRPTKAPRHHRPTSRPQLNRPRFAVDLDRRPGQTASQSRAWHATDSRGRSDSNARRQFACVPIALHAIRRRNLNRPATDSPRSAARRPARPASLPPKIPRRNSATATASTRDASASAAASNSTNRVTPTTRTARDRDAFPAMQWWRPLWRKSPVGHAAIRIESAPGRPVFQSHTTFGCRDKIKPTADGVRDRRRLSGVAE